MDLLCMGTEIEEVMVETLELQSELLKRTVRIDFYQPENAVPSSTFDLLLVNDGQDLVTMDFDKIFRSLNIQKKLKPLLVAGIHCSADRKNEYGMSEGPDNKGWGTKALVYEQFIVSELLPFIHNRFQNFIFNQTAFAGFSLGALSAFDIAWNHPEIFSVVGAFSGSFWWRSLDKDDKEYNPWLHRKMHQQVMKSEYHPGMKFFFQCGEQDEWEDRNKNGVIDSIDDTLDLMRLLLKKGYLEGKDMKYLQLPDGKHDVASWAKAFPHFLKWAWKEKNEK
jgi:enterochelin esterase-like enzyme